MGWSDKQTPPFPSESKGVRLFTIATEGKISPAYRSDSGRTRGREEKIPLKWIWTVSWAVHSNASHLHSQNLSVCHYGCPTTANQNLELVKYTNIILQWEYSVLCRYGKGKTVASTWDKKAQTTSTTEQRYNQGFKGEITGDATDQIFSPCKSAKLQQNLSNICITSHLMKNGCTIWHAHHPPDFILK